MSDQTFLPSVSTLLSKDSVPVAVVTSVLDLEQLLDNLFYKYFDVNVIGKGEGKSYRITMVSFGTAQCTIPSTEITLSINKGDLGTEFDSMANDVDAKYHTIFIPFSTNVIFTMSNRPRYNN